MRLSLNCPNSSLIYVEPYKTFTLGVNNEFGPLYLYLLANTVTVLCMICIQPLAQTGEIAKGSIILSCLVIPNKNDILRFKFLALSLYISIKVNGKRNLIESQSFL